MGGMLTMETLLQLRNEGKDRVIARLGRVVLAAPDIDAHASGVRRKWWCPTTTVDGNTGL